MASAESGYVITELGTLPGGDQAEATGISDTGEVVGWSGTASGYYHAFSYKRPHVGMVDLGALCTTCDSFAYGVNDSGEVVGYSGTPGADQAFSYTPSGGMVDLGTLGGFESDAYGVNDSGEVVGWSSTARGYGHAFSYTPSGGMVDLGALCGTCDSQALAVSDNGEIVGWSTTPSGYEHAFSYTPSGGMVDLGTPSDAMNSRALAVSDSGEIVGESYETPPIGPPYHAFSYTPSGGMVDLGTLGGSSSVGDGVDDSGQVAGWSYTGSSEDLERAFIYTPSKGMLDLGTLGGANDSGANAMNNIGDVVGWSSGADGSPGGAVLWQPSRPTAPTVTAVSPASGPTAGGTTVTITGASLTRATAVSFGSTAAASFTVDSGTEITATSPAETAGTVDVTVTTPAGTSRTSSADQFTYDAAPTVTGVSPNMGPTAGGNTVTITGAKYVSGATVDFGTVPATVESLTGTQITVNAPAQYAQTVDVTVTTPAGTSGTSTADQYTYRVPPTVSSIKPNTGAAGGGTSVTINGSNFLPGAAVSFGGTRATSVTRVSGSELQALAPAGPSGAVPLTVTTAGGTSTATKQDLFAYGAPTITSFTPASGITGSSITITGTGFVPGTSVEFGTLASPKVTLVSGTQITAVVPNGDPGPAAVTVADAEGSATSATEFTPTLSITGFSPASGPPGTLVTITGLGFNSTLVKFGGTASDSVTRVSSTELQATVPAGAATGPISVTNASSPTGTVRSTTSFTVS